MSAYWENVIPEILDELGIDLGEGKVKELIEAIEGCDENKSTYCGYDVAHRSSHSEIERMKKELAEERSKVVCPQCKGQGGITVHWLDRSSSSTCWKCNGEGKVKP